MILPLICFFFVMQSPDRQIDLFCKLESPDRIHAVIADVLMEGAVRSLEVVVCCN